MLETDAAGVILLVIGGYKGAGMSVKTTDPGLQARLPELLRKTAKLIEEEEASQ